MKSLKGIYFLILFIKIVFGISALLSLYSIFHAPMAENNYVNFGKLTYSLNDPYLEISSQELQYSLHSALSNVHDKDLVLTVGKIHFTQPISLEYKLITILIILLFSAILLMLLHALQKIVKSISEGNSFTADNIRRLQTIGLLVAISPIVEFCIEYGCLWWLNVNYSLEGLKVVADTKLGFFTFMIGLIIYTVAFAFQHGYQMKLEQDLTV